MSTMREMAAECRAEADALETRLKQKRAAHAPRRELELLESMLRELRVREHVLGAYYDAPRASSITMSCAYAPKRARSGDG